MQIFFGKGSKILRHILVYNFILSKEEVLLFSGILARKYLHVLVSGETRTCRYWAQPISACPKSRKRFANQIFKIWLPEIW